MSDGPLRCPFGHRINLNRPISRQGSCRECKQLYNHTVQRVIESFTTISRDANIPPEHLPVVRDFR